MRGKGEREMVGGEEMEVERGEISRVVEGLREGGRKGERERV